MQILLAVGVLPALFLMHYVYKLDRVEKEPMGLLFQLAGAGALSCFPAAIIESMLGKILDANLPEEADAYAFISAFFIVALAEEGCKFIVLRLFTWNSQEFNCNFDGIVYAVFVSLGFAALENVMYLFEYGLSIALSRALLSIPGHATFGVFMGHHYSKAKKAMVFGRTEEINKHNFTAVISALLLHGFYDYCLMSNHEILYTVFFVFVVILDIVSIKLIKKESAADAPFEQWPMY